MAPNGQINALFFAVFLTRGKKTCYLLPPGLKCGRENEQTKHEDAGKRKKKKKTNTPRCR